MTGRIFISYRRVDSQYATDQIYDLLVRHFGAGTVFMDIDAIPLGVNFRDYIDQQVSTSDIVLAVIGDIWLTVTAPDGQVRLNDPNDFVRLEIEAALKQGIKLIPLYIGGVEGLPAKQLPDSLKELSMLNAIRIRRSTDFVPDVERLIRGLDNIRAEQEATRARNQTALEGIAAAIPAYSENLAALRDLSIEERRQRKALQDAAEDLAEQVSGLLAEPARCLRVDVRALQSRLGQLEDDLFNLRLKADQRRQEETQRVAQAAARTADQRADESRQTSQRAANQARLLTISGMISEILDEVGQVTDLNAKERRAQAAIIRSGEIALRSVQRVLDSPDELLHADIGLFQDDLKQLKMDWLAFVTNLEERRSKDALEEEQRRLKKTATEQEAREKAEADRITRQQIAADAHESTEPRAAAKPKPSPEARKTFQSVPVWAWGGGGVVLIALVIGLTSLLSGGQALSQMEEIATPTDKFTITEVSLPSSNPIPTAAPIDVSINPGDGAELVFIPAGEFSMGDENTPYANIVHTAETASFWAYKYEVTNEMFAAFLQDVGNAIEGDENNPYYGGRTTESYPITLVGEEWQAVEGQEAHPAAHISWVAAKDYCQWAGARLLTEAEWEKAARGGLEGNLYPWGDDLPVDNRIAVNGAGTGMPVGSYLPNGYGLYDMAGGVEEWTSSCDSSYPYDSSDGREDLNTYCYRIIRGFDGADESASQVAYRIGSEPNTQRFTNDTTGFRCGLDGSAVKSDIVSSTPGPYVSSTQAPTAAPIDVKINPVDGASLAYIPAGEFQMGSDDPTLKAFPVHTVYTDAFWLYQFEVTNEMYVAFLNDVGNQDYYHDNDPDRRYPIRLSGSEWRVDNSHRNEPVAFVTWGGADAYCEWAGARLPTEAEWEKAARGGLEGKLYPWGDEEPMNAKGVVNGAFYMATSALYAEYFFPPVGSYDPNGYGLYDVAGSVGEWTSSCKDPYPYDAQDGRENSNTCVERVFRGGVMQKATLLVAFRDSNSPFVGIRCVMDAP